MVVLYSERVGIRKGKAFLFSWQASWPLVKFEVQIDKVVLSLFWWKTVLHVSDIDSFESFGFTNFFGGIKIIHHNPNESPYILLYCVNRKRLLDKLLEFGFPVKSS